MNRRALLLGSLGSLATPKVLAQPMPILGPVGGHQSGGGPLWSVPNVPPGASLDLSFMNPGTLDPRVSFTRASGGTYFDRNGVMQNAATNLCLQSADLSNAAWSLGGIGGAPNPTVVGNQVVAPDGTTTAARITYPAISTAGWGCVVAQSITGTANPYSFSIWLRGSVGGERLYISANSGPFYSTMVTLTTSWQRFFLTTPALTAITWWFELGVDTRDGAQPSILAQTIYAWGGQFELGSTASPYIPTTSVPGGAPRWDYNPATLALQGLLIEEARTNVWLQSADASNAAWSKGYTGSASLPVVTGNNIVAPDGTTTAARIDLPIVTGVSSSQLSQGFAASVAPYTYSMWLRGAVGGERVWIFATLDTSFYYRTAITLTTAWQRFVLTTSNLTVATWYVAVGVDLRDASQTGTPAQTIYVWGAQVEQGAFPTSYIPTTAAAVTRAYDSCFIAPANMAPWFAPPGGSWAAEFIDNVPVVVTGTSPRVIGIHDASGITPLWESTPAAAVNNYDGSANAQTLNFITVGAISKGTSSWTPGTGNVCLNGGSVALGALSTGFATLATSGVGIMGGNPGVVNESMTGYIRRVRYWPRVLSNAELQSVTT